MTENAISSEVAEIEFDRWAAAWCLDTETETMTEEDRDSFNSLRRRLVRQIQGGSLTVDETGEILVYTLQFEIAGIQEFTLSIPKGNAIVRWDHFKDRESIQKLHSYMAAMGA